ncbi:RICIN domain-containing protein, partial [Streptomyces clavuligerus]
PKPPAPKPPAPKPPTAPQPVKPVKPVKPVNYVAKGPTKNRALNRCVDVVGGVVTDGAALRATTCSGQQRQRWEFRKDGEVWSRINRVYCMDVQWGNTGSGTPLQVAHCSGNPAQQLRLRSDGTIHNPRSGKCVEAVDEGGKRGIRLQLQRCDGSGAQRWLVG